MPKVSVIIPSTDKEETKLQDCLKSIRYSTYKDLEVIVVNEGFERSRQRNIGMERAKGDYLLILDSDQMVSPKLIEECVGLIKYGAGIYIPEIITTHGFFGYLRNWERQFYTGTAVDVVRFVRKSCPTFDETLNGPEDSDWDRCIKGWKFNSNNVLYHNDGVSLIGYLKKKIYYAKSMGRFAKKWPNDQVLNWKWRCFKVFFEKKKWKKVLRRPDLFICLMGLIFIRGVIYCLKKS